MRLSTRQHPSAEFTLFSILVPPSAADLTLLHSRPPHDAEDELPQCPSRYNLSLRVQVSRPADGTIRLPDLTDPFSFRLRLVHETFLDVLQTKTFDPAETGWGWRDLWETLEKIEREPNWGIHWGEDSLEQRLIAHTGLSSPLQRLEFSCLPPATLMDELLNEREDFSENMEKIFERLHQLELAQFRDLPTVVAFPKTIKVAFFGCTNSGKSTLINRLLSETIEGTRRWHFSEICPADDSPFTSVIWRIKWGKDPVVVLRKLVDEEESEIGERGEVYVEKKVRLRRKTYKKTVKRIMFKIRSGRLRVRPIVEVTLPHPLLKLFTFVDLPGVDEESLSEIVYEELASCHTICFVVDCSNSAFSTGERLILKTLKTKFEEPGTKKDVIQSMCLADKLLFIGNKVDRTIPQMIFDIDDDQEEEEAEEEGEFSESESDSPTDLIDLPLLKKEMFSTKRRILEFARDPLTGVDPKFSESHVLLTVAKKGIARNGQFAEFFGLLLTRFIRDMLRATRGFLFRRPASRMIDDSLRKIWAVYERQVSIRNGEYDAKERLKRLIQLKPDIVLALMLVGYRTTQEMKNRFENTLYASSEGEYRKILLQKMMALQLAKYRSPKEAIELLRLVLSKLLQNVLKKELLNLEIEIWKGVNQILVEIQHFQLLDLKLRAVEFSPQVSINSNGLQSQQETRHSSSWEWRSLMIGSLIDRSKKGVNRAIEAGVEIVVQPVVEEAIRIVTEEIAGLAQAIRNATAPSHRVTTQLLCREVEILSLQHRFILTHFCSFPLCVCERICLSSSLKSFVVKKSAPGKKTRIEVLKGSRLTEVNLHRVHLLRLFSETQRFPQFQGIRLFGSRALLLTEDFDLNLKDLLEDQTLGAIQRLNLALRTAEALALLHRRRRVHGRLLADRVFVDQEKKRAILVNFGESCYRPQGTARLYHGQIPFDPSDCPLPIDVFSFGLLLAQLWEQVRDFENLLGMRRLSESANSHVRLRRSYQDADTNLRSEIETVIQMCMVNDWEERWDIERVVEKLTNLLRRRFESDFSIPPSSVSVRKATHQLKIVYLAESMLESFVSRTGNVSALVLRFQKEVGAQTSGRDLQKQFMDMIHRIAVRSKASTAAFGCTCGADFLSQCDCFRLSVFDEPLVKPSQVAFAQSDSHKETILLLSGDEVYAETFDLQQCPSCQALLRYIPSSEQGEDDSKFDSAGFVDHEIACFQIAATIVLFSSLKKR